MPDNRTKRVVAPNVERLEDRLTPAAAVPLSESLDPAPLGQLPAGWSQWSSTGQPVFGTTNAVAASPGQSLAASTAKDWVTAAAWSNTVQPANVEVSASVFLHQNMPL